MKQKDADQARGYKLHKAYLERGRERERERDRHIWLIVMHLHKLQAHGITNAHVYDVMSCTV